MRRLGLLGVATAAAAIAIGLAGMGPAGAVPLNLHTLVCGDHLTGNILILNNLDCTGKLGITVTGTKAQADVNFNGHVLSNAGVQAAPGSVSSIIEGGNFHKVSFGASGSSLDLRNDQLTGGGVGAFGGSFIVEHSLLVNADMSENRGVVRLIGDRALNTSVSAGIADVQVDNSTFIGSQTKSPVVVDRTNPDPSLANPRAFINIGDQATTEVKNSYFLNGPAAISLHGLGVSATVSGSVFNGQDYGFWGNADLDLAISLTNNAFVNDRVAGVALFPGAVGVGTISGNFIVQNGTSPSTGIGAGDGIFVAGLPNPPPLPGRIVVANNIIERNRNLGVEALSVSALLNGGGNTILFNGNPLQAIGL